MKVLAAILVIVVVEATSIFVTGQTYDRTGSRTGGRDQAGATGGDASRPTTGDAGGRFNLGSLPGSLPVLGGVGAGQGGSGLPVFGGPSGDQGAAPFVGRRPGTTVFTSSVIQQQVTPTVTQTTTIDSFTTLRDTVFLSYSVTLTQFVVETVTRPLQQVVITPTNDIVVISTTVVDRPEYITVTETKSDFRLAVRTSITHFTLTHTSYAITHVPFTITDTQTVQLTSQVVRTVINTVSRLVTDYRTILNTRYVHGY